MDARGVHADERRGVEAVADASNGGDQVFAGKFGTEATNVRINRAGLLPQVACSPHGFQEFLTGHAVIGTLREVGEQRVFLAGQCDFSVVDRHAVAFAVDFNTHGFQAKSGEDVEEFVEGRGGGVAGVEDGCGGQSHEIFQTCSAAPLRSDGERHDGGVEAAVIDRDWVNHMHIREHMEPHIGRHMVIAWKVMTR